jgi:hypothetical protein
MTTGELPTVLHLTLTMDEAMWALTCSNLARAVVYDRETLDEAVAQARKTARYVGTDTVRAVGNRLATGIEAAGWTST